MKQRTDGTRHSDSNAAAASSGTASATAGEHNEERITAGPSHESDARGVREVAAARQNQINSKLPATSGNFKREQNNDNPADDSCDEFSGGNNTISVGVKWDPLVNFSSAPSSSVAASDRSVATVPIKSIEDDPATISKAELALDPSLTSYAHALRTSHTPSLEITPMQGDGNCLFRAISLQVYGSEDMHPTVRTQCLDFMKIESQHFKHFVAEDYGDYIARKRCDGVHGNHTEIQAASELYNRRIEVYVPPKLEPMNIFQQEEENSAGGKGPNTYASPSNHPIRLLYMDGNHYDALIDPLVPTAGLGLGLPGLQPGLADKLQLDQAKAESNQIIQKNMEQKIQLALEESVRVQEQKEGEEIERVLRESCTMVGKGGRTERDELDDAFQKKAIYMSELDSADFDLEQAVSSVHVALRFS